MHGPHHDPPAPTPPPPLTSRVVEASFDKRNIAETLTKQYAAGFRYVGVIPMLDSLNNNQQTGWLLVLESR